VERFSKDGYQVIATVSPGKKLDYVANGKVDVVQLDLTNEKLTAETVASVVKKYQTIDAALLLVGGFAMGNIEKTDGAAIQKMFSLNFETAYHVARPVFMQMMKQSNGGRMVLIGSRPSLVATEGKSKLAYALSKSLIFQLAEYLNAEGAPHNVTATVIAPSTIDTPENRKSMPKANSADWVKPEEIADIMYFACSDKGNPLRQTVLKVYGNS
jgi:NAD(P)-dependent dehydrogenase (short-subunit alcohol dehydrogenase family)